jgi:arylsulfatase A-like enzyme
MTDSRPNVLFIHVDQWRADALGFTGRTPAETPHLDGLFEQGILCEAGLHPPAARSPL